MENQNAAKKRKNKLGTRRKGFIIAFLAPTLIAFCVFYLYPIITVFITSFCKWDYTNITSPEFSAGAICGIIMIIFLTSIHFSGKH